MLLGYSLTQMEFEKNFERPDKLLLGLETGKIIILRPISFRRNN